MKKHNAAPFARHGIFLAVLGAFLSNSASATCVTSGTTTTCDATGTQTTTIGIGPTTPSGWTVILAPGAHIATTEPNAISLGNNANITISDGAIVENNSTSAAGLYSTGGNTIELNDHSRLTIGVGAKVLATGTQPNGEAINLEGSGSVIINNGEIHSTHAAAIWFQETPGINTVINNATGIIATDVAGWSIIGSTGPNGLDFTNKGTVIGNMFFTSGNDVLRIYTGSSVSGNIDGNGGNNVLFLYGEGYAALGSNIANFQTLNKQDNGTWTLNGAIAGLATVNVNRGTLAIGDSSHAGNTMGATVNVASSGTLGGYGEVDGTVNNSGTIAVANAIAAFSNNANGNFTVNGTLNNGGLIQIGGTGVGNTLTVSGGSYVGQNGTIALNTALGGDGSASDRFILNGVAATGSTKLRINNVGGSGARTTGDGILVVSTTNGGTTGANAFSLAGPVSAGAYTYRLYKGNLATGTGEDWYLRSSTQTVDASGNTVNTMLYRQEVPLYSAIPSVARNLGIQQLDNFHGRQGDQGLLTSDADANAAWGRVWGESLSLAREGAFHPAFDGKSMGFQVGQDLYTDRVASGEGSHAGLFFSYGHADGRVKGNAEGGRDIAVGHLATDAYGVGAYWSHIGTGGWYADTVVTSNYLNITTNSGSGIAAATHGNALVGSVETGFPLIVGPALKIEPQAQLLWQRIQIEDINDSAGNVRFGTENNLVGRVGVRAQSLVENAFAVWRPYVRADVLRNLERTDNLTFDQTNTLSTSGNRTVGQVGAGVVAAMSKSGSMYANVTRSFDLNGEKYSTTSFNIGARWVW